MKNDSPLENNNLDFLQLKEETTDEKFMRLKISEVEETNLWRVFEILCGTRVFKENEDKWFDSSDVKRILKKLGVKNVTQQKVDLMIWEVDENLDKRVDEKEFELMYKKCIEDKNFLEPKNLFNLVQYLMFCKTVENTTLVEENIHDFNTTIIPEDTYFLIYARLDRQIEDDSKRDMLDEEIRIIFGENEKNPDGTDKKIDYITYLQKVNDYGLEVRKRIRENQKMTKVAQKDKENKL